MLTELSSIRAHQNEKAGVLSALKWDIPCCTYLHHHFRHVRLGVSLTSFGTPRFAVAYTRFMVHSGPMVRAGLLPHLRLALENQG